MKLSLLTMCWVRYTVIVGGGVMLLLAWTDSPQYRDPQQDLSPDASPVLPVELNPRGALSPVGRRSEVKGDAVEANPGLLEGVSLPEPGPSPADLHPPEVAEFFRPTRENFDKWVSEMRRGDVAEILWAIPDVQYAWCRIQEYRAINAWCTEYQDRELDRWKNQQASVPLDQELGPFMPWLLERSPDPAMFRALVDEYSQAAIREIWSVGEDAEITDDSASRWGLTNGIVEFPYFADSAAFVESILASLEESK